MSVIHISRSNGQTTQHPEAQVRSMLLAKVINRDTLSWKEGMAEWLPLKELFPDLSPTISNAPPTYKFSKDPRGLTHVLKIMLWMQLGIGVLSILSDFWQLRLINSDFVSSESAEANDSRQAAIGMVYLGSYIVTGIIFLMWIYRANLNCHGFGASGMQTTPGWSVGFFFIPIVSLFRPYQAMKEIWQVSTDPKNWQAQQGSSLLGWWWALWLTASVGARVFASSAAAVDSAEEFETATLISIGSELITIPLNTVAVMMITRIIQKQINLVQASVETTHHTQTV